MTGSSKTTTTSNSEPWKGAQPALQQGISEAQRLYNSGTGSQVYTGSTVVPRDEATTAGLNAAQWGASQNVNGAGLSGQLQGLINSGGINQDQKNVLGALYGEASGANSNLDTAAGWFDKILNANGYNAATTGAQNAFQNVVNSGGYNPALTNAQNTFQGVVNSGGYNDALKNALGINQNVVNSGGYNDAQRAALGNTQTLANSQYSISPELQRVLDAQSQKVSESVNANAAGAGRYGSGSNQTLLAKNVGDLANSTIYNDYTNFLGRRDTANNNLFSMGQTGQGNVSAAGNNIASIGQNALNNMQSAAGNVAQIGQGALGNLQSAAGNVAQIGQGALSNVANAGANVANIGQNIYSNRANALASINNLSQQGINNLGSAYQGILAPSQTMMQVGGANEDLATRQLNDQLRIFNEQQNKPWENLSRLQAIASGAGQLGGSQTTSQPGQNPFLTALGYGLTGGGILGGIF